MPAKRWIASVALARASAQPISKMGRLGLCIVAVFSLTANHCPLHDDDDGPAAQSSPPQQPPPQQPPPEEPPSEEPPSASDAACWEGLPDFDETAGCYQVSFDASAGDLEIHEAVMTLPDGVTFNGFSVAGPDGTPVGTLSLDVGRDGVTERTMLFLSTGDELAYVDMIEDEIFSPPFEPAFGQIDRYELFLHMPFGGDADAETLTLPAALSVTLRLREEILATRGMTGASFTVSGELTSVDPDTGDYDDEIGAGPTVTPFTAEVEIVEPEQS